jgi:capsular exopolysaccharide synthesis family protein
VTIREFFGVLRARWRLVALCVLLALAAAAVTTMTATPVYEAQAQVYLATEKPASARTGERGGTYVITRTDLNTYVVVLTSPSVMGPLRERLGLPADAPINLTASVSDVTNVLEFTARSDDPRLAAEIANVAGPVLAERAQRFSPLLALSGQSVEADAIAPAPVPTRPVSPNAEKNLMLGGLLGLILGVGAALIRQVSDTRVRGEDDVKRLSDRPILGTIPAIKSADASILSIETDPHGRHAESIRRLRTNILFVDVTTQGHSFVITSSNPGEGKTTTTINLAMAMADAGSRVLLIDGDLRNPSVAKALGIEGSVGLTTILLGRATPQDVVHRWGESTLHVLPAGQIPPNPSELLGSEAMSDLFDKLSQDYDFILVDSPPINPVIDAVLINKLTHGLIMVVASDRTKRRDLENALGSLSTVEVPVAGFALNLVSGNGGAAYQYGYYGYGRTAEIHASRTHRREKRGRSLARRSG